MDVPLRELELVVPVPAIPAALPPMFPVLVPPTPVPVFVVGELAFGTPEVPPPPVKSVPGLPTPLGVVTGAPVVDPVTVPPPVIVELIPWAQTGELLRSMRVMKRIEILDKFL
jgi:hypothetical protein